MSVDVAIELACQPRAKLGSDGLLTAVKSQGQAAVIEQLATRQGVPPERLRVDLSGSGERVLDYPDLRAQAVQLTGLEAFCAGCPANIFRPTFGCLTAVRYPIGAEAERWLVEHLPAEAERPPGADIVRALRDFSIDGRRGAEMRQRGFLEAPAPAVGRIGNVEVTSDQILELLLFSRHESGVMRMLLLAFGAVEPVPADRIMAAYHGEEPLRPSLLPGDDDARSIGDFKRLFLAFLVGSRLDAPVRVAP